ncbi:hypothetical protein DO97_11925 [Neosynechococcus sphagnicola sy1]|uniref:Uncharacterized protein n=1 Tax=Neosynechococcus sphagnicola sy1 TaxID=1497020 RepID=A0A098TJW6_9CYAN|nr:hypothetical protein [Neosynechococcus sphagnicola]KGF72137.1 hypothetical protein DO97_11925 [Neosynechococcus sphagnicola sy1]
MIAIKTIKQIATSRTIPSFRSGRVVTGLSYKASDKARMATGYAQLLASRARRRWLNRLYSSRILLH